MRGCAIAEVEDWVWPYETNGKMEKSELEVENEVILVEPMEQENVLIIGVNTFLRCPQGGDPLYRILGTDTTYT